MSKIIELSHALKVELLKAIQYGKLDLELFSGLNDDLTLEVINSEMERLLKLDRDFETCRILQKIGQCKKDCNK